MDSNIKKLTFWILGVTRLKTILGNSEKKKNEIANKEIYLPMDLLRLLLPRLSLKDNICASAVCKTWYEAAVSVRDHSPWLVYFDIDLSGVSDGFLDPMEKKETKLPNLSIYACICYSKNGWLLMEDYHEGAKRVFFLDSFTREYIKLRSFTKIGTIGTELAFSCAPTNQSYVVCGINNSGAFRFSIHTWYLGAVERIEMAFDPIAHNWDNLHVPLPDLSPFLRCITEYNGNIFLVDVLSNIRRRLVVFGFNRVRSVWERKKRFDGLSIFVSDESSIMTYGLTRHMRNIVYVWDSNFNLYHPSKYSLYTNSFCTDPEGYCVESSTNDEMHYGAWVEPPQNSSIYDFSIIEPSLMAQ